MKWYDKRIGDGCHSNKCCPGEQLHCYIS